MEEWCSHLTSLYLLGVDLCLPVGVTALFLREHAAFLLSLQDLCLQGEGLLSSLSLYSH